LAPRKISSSTSSGASTIGRGRHRPVPAHAHELEGHDRGDHHRAGHGDTIGGRQRIRAAEADDQEDDAEEQQHVDRRHEDLPGVGFRGEEDFHARQEAEVDALADQREGAGDDRLAGDDGGGGREDDDRQQRPFGNIR
jgi:hypothetical protein